MIYTMQELIKYFEVLEARLSAQETRLAAQDAKIVALEQQLAAAEQRMSETEQRLAAQATSEPEVEVDLIYPEDEEVTVELPQEESSQPEPTVEQETTDNPEIPGPAVEQPEPTVEPTSAPEPEPQPAVEPTVEPIVEQPKPEAPRAPQQTTLFGTPVADIRQAVSIGDRFLFQRELFAGNAEKLQQTLTELNNLHSLDEAVALVEKFGWDKQSPTYELFMNVLHRRFQ